MESLPNFLIVRQALLFERKYEFARANLIPQNNKRHPAGVSVVCGGYEIRSAGKAQARGDTESADQRSSNKSVSYPRNSYHISYLTELTSRVLA